MSNPKPVDPRVPVLKAVHHNEVRESLPGERPGGVNVGSYPRIELNGTPLSPSRLEELGIVADCLERGWLITDWGGGRRRWEIRKDFGYASAPTLREAWIAARGGRG